MSAILSVDDLNDFISPGVACIKPVETLPAAPQPSEPDSLLEHEVIIDDGRQPSQLRQDGASTAGAPPAQISLTDCLACSGCVTSAEAVLVSLQSHSELLSVLDSAPALHVRGPDAEGRFAVEGLEDESRRLFVASVSPQTRASLAAACGGGTTEEQTGHMLEQLLAGDARFGGSLAAGGKWGNRFVWVVDTSAAREACLVLGSDEVLGSTAAAVEVKKPILTSSCPGWVCYAEKTHPYVLPHLSRVKSPQALTGTLLKTILSRMLGIPSHRIWHLAVMPCFDKKLEASRQELTDAAWQPDGVRPAAAPARDVDCVITSKEIFMLTESRGIDFFGLPKTAPSPPSSQLHFPDAKIHDFLFPARTRPRPARAAGSSGGNLHFILQDVLSRHPGSQLQTTRGRNADVVDYAVVGPDDAPIFRAARYYGFRNIQNLVRRLKPARPSRMPGGKPIGAARKAPTGRKQVAGTGGAAGMEHAYVEVMACPGGCTNGGGQVKADDQVVMDQRGFVVADGAKPGPLEQKALLAEVDEAYFSADDEPGTGESEGVEVIGRAAQPSHIRDVLVHWAGLTGIELNKLVYTSYREVISNVGKDAGMTDTERVVQLAGKIGGGW